MDFIPAARYEGSRPGYVFKTDSRGLGYYADKHLQGIDDRAAAGKDKRRVIDDHDLRADPLSKRPRMGVPAVEEVLEEAESSAAQPLDAAALKAKLLSFERRISKNQEMRMKFPHSPEKFLESEIELHDELQELFPVAAAPELFPLFVSLGAVKSILGVLTHENTDISLAALSLLQELTDPDAFTVEDFDDSVDPLVLVDEFVREQGIELIVQNLSRLDETQEEDALGVSRTLTILENIIEAKEALAEEISRRTNVMVYLLRRLSNQSYDAIKLHCSEVLAILLQNSGRNQEALPAVDVDGRSGLELLLQIIFSCRKLVPSSTEEAECIENTFLALRSALLITRNRDLFLENEGFELMIKCLKEGAYAATCALKTLSFAITSSTASCIRFVEVGGLRYLFPAFMGKSVTKNFTKKKGVKLELEQTAVSILSELCSQLVLSPEDAGVRSIFPRLMSKFSENDLEKVHRCVELFNKYKLEVKATEQELILLRRDIEATGDAAALEEFDDDDYRYAKLLSGGLFTLQQVSKVIALVYLYGGDKIQVQVTDLLVSSDSSVHGLIDIMREAASRIASDSSQVTGERSVLVTLSAALAKTVSQTKE